MRFICWGFESQSCPSLSAIRPQWVLFRGKAFILVCCSGKGNKYREIAVSDQMLEALIRYQTVCLPELPRKAEQTLMPKVKRRGQVRVKYEK